MDTIPLLFNASVAHSGNRLALIEPVEDNTLKVKRQETLTALPEIRKKEKEG